MSNKTNFRKKYFKGALIVPIITTFIFIMSSLLITATNLSDGASEAGRVERTLSEPFLCNEFYGLGEGTYQHYCSFTELFSSGYTYAELVFGSFCLVAIYLVAGLFIIPLHKKLNNIS